MINISRKEFSESFLRHYNFYKLTSGYEKPRRLILFYSVECGLKSLLLQNIGKNSYYDLLHYEGMDGLNKSGHDLKFMLKKLGVQVKFPLRDINLNNGSKEEVKKFNELWRYGLSNTNVHDEKNAEEVLLNIANWINEQI